VKTIVVNGGTSGIGLAAAREFLARGHHVVILGRNDLSRRERDMAFGEASSRATILTADLSSQAGVRDIARVLVNMGSIDAVLHTAGVVLLEDRRTTDTLSLALSINYLARYHLTQMLLPALRLSERPHVVMMTARVEPSFAIDFGQFPDFASCKFPASTDNMWIANYHYAAHLVRSEPRLLAGIVHPGRFGTRSTGACRAVVHARCIRGSRPSHHELTEAVSSKPS
jgi:NAD(P)-dependent dehydrogenase (short-subunit alcohol dehydrogenase family)